MTTETLPAASSVSPKLWPLMLSTDPDASGAFGYTDVGFATRNRRGVSAKVSPAMRRRTPPAPATAATESPTAKASAATRRAGSAASGSSGRDMSELRSSDTAPIVAGLPAHSD